MSKRHTHLRFMAAIVATALLVVLAACSPTASSDPGSEPVREAPADVAALTEVTPAAEEPVEALPPAPVDEPTVTPVPPATPSAAATQPAAYPEPVAESLPSDAYPAPALAEGLEGYPGVSIVDAPEGLDLDPAQLGASLPSLLTRFADTGETVDAEALAEDPLLALILADAAARTGTQPDALALVGLEAVTWPDTSLGCPDPERGYAQVEVEGYILTLADGADTFTYHTDGGLQLVLCLDGTPQAVGSTPEQ